MTSYVVTASVYVDGADSPEDAQSIAKEAFDIAADALSADVNVQVVFPDEPNWEEIGEWCDEAGCPKAECVGCQQNEH